MKFSKFLPIFLLITSAIHPLFSQKSKSTKPTLESAREAVQKTLILFDEAYINNDEVAFKNLLSKDIQVYGTDATNLWKYDIFQNHIKDTNAQGIPKMHLIKLNEILLDEKGSSAFIIRELSWKGVFDDNTIRQTLFMVKEEGTWMVKSIVLGHLLADKN